MQYFVQQWERIVFTDEKLFPVEQAPKREAWVLGGSLQLGQHQTPPQSAVRGSMGSDTEWTFQQVSAPAKATQECCDAIDYVQDIIPTFHHIRGMAAALSEGEPEGLKRMADFGARVCA